MYYLGEVFATQAATAEPGDSCIRFTSMLKLDNLHSDFKILVEVYTFQTQPKYLPHEKKYHINHTVKVSLKARSFLAFLFIKYIINTQEWFDLMLNPFAGGQ